MKAKSLLFILLSCLFISKSAKSTHTLNYFYTYKVIDKTSQNFKIKLNIEVYQDCYFTNPNAQQADLMLGIYNPQTKARIQEVQIPFYGSSKLDNLSNASINGCFSKSDYSVEITLNHNASSQGYLFQLNTCCYANFYRNIDMVETPGVFHEFTVPSGLDSGFQASTQKYNTIFPIRSKTSSLLNFAEAPNDFDSIRYQLIPAYEDPGIQSYTPWYVSPTAYIVDTMRYEQGYTWDRPMGVNVDHVFSDTGTLLIKRNFNFGYHQIAIKTASYLDGTPYYGIRYITVMVTYQLNPKLSIKADLIDSTKVQIEHTLIDFNSFTDAQILRASLKNSPYAVVQNIGNGSGFSTDSTLTFGNSYYYQLRGIDGIDTFYSDTIQISSRSIRPNIELLKESVSENLIKLKWNSTDLPYTATYTLERSFDSLSQYQLLKTLSDTFFADSSVGPGIKYYYRLNSSFGTYSLNSILGIQTPGWPLNVQKSREEQYKAYPNPGKVKLNLKSINNSKVIIRNLQGQLIYTGILTDGENQIDISTWKNGVYFIQIGTKSIRYIKID